MGKKFRNIFEDCYNHSSHVAPVIVLEAVSVTVCVFIQLQYSKFSANISHVFIHSHEIIFSIILLYNLIVACFH